MRDCARSFASGTLDAQSDKMQSGLMNWRATWFFCCLALSLGTSPGAAAQLENPAFPSHLIDVRKIDSEHCHQAAIRHVAQSHRRAALPAEHAMPHTPPGQARNIALQNKIIGDH